MNAQDKVGAPQSLARATMAGFAWLMLQSVGARIIAFGSQLVLAWLLVPEDFGIIGLATTLTTITGTLVNFGLDDVLLQRQHTLRLWSPAAFWVSLSLGFLGMGLLLLAAVPAALVYHAPGLTGLIVTMAIAYPVGALVTVPTVALRAALQFRFLAVWGTIDLLGVQLLTIGFALLGFGAYSFAIPLPIMAAVRAVVFWRTAPPHIRARVRLRNAVHLMRNGSVVFGTRILTELVGQGGYIALGVLASPTVVGTYYFAFRLAAQPVRMLAGNFQNVLFPALATIRNDEARQGAAAAKAARILAFVVMPLCFLQAAVAEPLLLLLFGTKWAASIPLVQVLSIGLPFDAVSWIAGALLHARGEFRRSLVFSIAAAPPFFAAVIVGGWSGSALGVALGVSAFYMIVSPIYSWLVFRSAGIGTLALVQVYALPMVLSVLTMGGAYLLSLAGPLAGSPMLRLVFIGALGPLAYAAGVFILDRGAFMELVDRLGVRRILMRLRLA